jgi:hypothetical protein
MVVFLGVVLFTYLIGVAVIPGFDRRMPINSPQPAVANVRRATASRGA